MTSCAGRSQARVSALPEFAEGAEIPSSENIVRWIHRQLTGELPQGADLVLLRLEEDEDLEIVEIMGDEEDGPASLKTKAEILKYLNDSFNYVQKAVATIDAKNVISPIKSPFGEGPATRAAMVTLIVGHCYDHYGQLVEYVRMNGIAPPASQR